MVQSLSLYQASLSTLTQHGVEPSLAQQASEIIARDMVQARSPGEQEIINQVVARLNGLSLEQYKAAIAREAA